MANDAKVIVPIEADNRPLKQTLSDTTSAIEKESRKWDKSTGDAAGSMESKMTAMFAKISAAAIAAKVGKTLLEWGKDAIAAASDLEEVQNVVDVTFGDNANQIDAWAKNAISQFGLTETKAKQFASTLGAMMKSAGMAGPEIVEMSENLAGLAADMSSFYNMDFDTAFQKIRSGISGETEPLKQLGINMSVANLEAYALQQGITKTFDQMNQGEQTMLRYQYLMQATADAQGDFARTSDGYANGLRLLESNINSIKTQMGQVLIPVLASATTHLNNFLGSLTKERPQTILDTFNDIDVDTSEKIARIEETDRLAKNLILTLQDLDNTNASAALKAIAEGANVLDADSPNTWKGLLDAIDESTNIQRFGNDASGAAIGIEDLANALSGADGKQKQAEAFVTLIGTLEEHAEDLTDLTGLDGTQTKEWLQGLADSANALDDGKADDWNKLLSRLVAGLPGLENTDAGKTFFDAMAANFLAMGSDSERAKAGLATLGWSTDQIESKQRVWLETCKRLVETIPGLSDIINTQTGEVQGGTEAITAYVKAWKEGQLQIAYSNALQKKRDAYAQALEDMADIQLNLEINTPAYNDVMKKVEALRKKAEEAGAVFDDEGNWIGLGKNESASEALDELEAFIKLNDDIISRQKELETALNSSRETANAAAKNLDDAAAIMEKYGGEAKEATESIDGASEAILKFDEATQKAAVESIKTFESALKSLTDYTEKAYQSSRQSIINSLGGFAKMVTPAEQARQKVKDVESEIAKLRAAGKSTTELELKMTGYDEAVPTIQNITAGLKSQARYLQEYINNIEKMRALGFSDDVLAMVSDGSAQSADYAAELAKAGNAEVEEINKQVAAVKAKTSELASSLAENNLAVDENVQQIINDYTAALEGLNQYDKAKQNAADTIQGILDGLDENAANVRSQVDNILSMLAELSGASYGLNIPGITYSGTGGNGTIQVNTSLTLDGRTVAAAVSTHQANSLKQMERSGMVMRD